VRILISPRPVFKYSAGIFLRRIAIELTKRNYSYTAMPFAAFGRSIIPWDYAFMMGTPRFRAAILQSRKPFVVTMGKPELKEWCQAVAKPYLPEHDFQEQQMAEVIRNSEKVVFISRYVQSIWREIFTRRQLKFPREENVRIIFHGVDTSLFSPPRTRRNDVFVLGSAGALREGYRLQTLFSVSRLLEFDHRLLIVGSLDDDCRAELNRALDDRLLARRITYVPWVHSEELPAYYRTMDCLFHPVDYEGCGIVVIEALSCGVPVIVPANGAPHEYMSADAGIAVPVKKYSYGPEFCQRMADAVTRVRDRWDVFSEGARRCALERLSITQVVDDYLSFLGLPFVVSDRRR